MQFGQRVRQSPSLALGVSMAKYYFDWYVNDSSQMDVGSVGDAANLMYASIQFSGCNRVDLPLDIFLQRMCTVRWPYAVLMYSELGREYATRYLTEEAATALEQALAAFDEMKRMPYYAQVPHWQSPYDINFNEAWFPTAASNGPIWDTSRVPLAHFLESNSEAITDELKSLIDRKLFDTLPFADLREEGQDHAPENGWRAVELMADSHSVEPGRIWSTKVCGEAPRTCGLLASRPELQGCQSASASFVRLRAGGRLKPHFSTAPRLRCGVPLITDSGARMSVGNRTVTWKLREPVVFDDTFIRQDWHAGVAGDFYMLQIAFCHPCEESQRVLYGNSVACGQDGLRDGGIGATISASTVASPPASVAQPVVAEVPFAAAALWAASLPELAHCHAGIGEKCQPDTQHGGANPLSALNTWNYALNNLKAAILHSGVQVDPQLWAAVLQVQAAMQEFFAMPALDRFAPITSTALQIFEAMAPWLQQQPASRVLIGAATLAASQGIRLPADGSGTPSSVTFPLANGVQMPAVGFGTWKLEGDACYNAVKWALESGIRHVDSAEAYQNEADIGRAIRDSSVPRKELFITTKATSVALGMAGPEYLETVFVGQLNSLQTDYIDVYMLHAGGVKGDVLKAVWQGMERMFDLGRVRALGVSNFGVEELETLWGFARIKPTYLQNIFKVYKQGEQIFSGSSVSTVAWAKSHNMAVAGYSTINSWPHILSPLEDPHVLTVAQAHGRTASQVLHRWALQHGIAVIPKASSKERIRENARLFDFELTPLEMVLLDGLVTLSEGIHDEVRPTWSSDTFGLQRPGEREGILSR